MKDTHRIVKIVAVIVAIAAAVCLVVAFRDKISDLFHDLADKLEERRCSCGCDPDEFEDYADTEL